MKSSRRVSLALAPGLMLAASAVLLRLLTPAGFSQGSDITGSSTRRDPSQKEKETGATGAVEGRIRFRGEVPKSAVPDDAGARRDLLQVDRESRGLANVAVWLKASGAPTNPPSPSADAAPPPTMDQRDHEFVPRVLAVRAGQAVRFTNSDPANHNVRTSSRQSANQFNVFTGAEGSYSHRFSADPQHQPVRVGCDIHPWMRGWIYVLEHTHCAVSDVRGRFRIHSIPAGEQTLVIRQPDIRYSRERPVVVKPGAITLLEIEISAADMQAP